MLCVPKPEVCLHGNEQRQIFNFMAHVDSTTGIRKDKGLQNLIISYCLALTRISKSRFQATLQSLFLFLLSSQPKISKIDSNSVCFQMLLGRLLQNYSIDTGVVQDEPIT